MNSAEEKAIAVAKGVLKYAYAQYSGLKVGSPLAAQHGRVFSGANVENASYGLTICAERVAMVKAISEGAKEFSLLALTSSAKSIISPCGACLQFLAEFCPDLDIIIIDGAGQINRATLSQLLPRRFTL